MTELENATSNALIRNTVGFVRVSGFEKPSAYLTDWGANILWLDNDRILYMRWCPEIYEVNEFHRQGVQIATLQPEYFIVGSGL